MLSGIIIEVSTYAFIRVAFSVFTLRFLRLLPIFDILSWLGAVAIIIGSLLAITQVNLKRMLAYSSVANMGYIVLALGLSISARTVPWGGLNPALMHVLNHALMKGCLFLAAGAFIYKADLWYIKDFQGLGKKMPYTCAAFVIAAISMIGVPPSVGFVSKLYMILASIESGKSIFVAVLLISSLLNLVYFWRVIETMYMKKAEGENHSHASNGSHVQREEVPLGMLLPIWVLASLCIIMGILWLANVPIPILNQVNSMFGLDMRP